MPIRDDRNKSTIRRWGELLCVCLAAAALSGCPSASTPPQPPQPPTSSPPSSSPPSASSQPPSSSSQPPASQPPSSQSQPPAEQGEQGDPSAAEGEQTADASQGSPETQESGEAGSMEDMDAGGMEGAESVLSETADGTSSSEGGESEALPDFSEEDPLDAALESFEEAMETAAAEAAEGGQAGGMPGAEADESGSPPGGSPGESGESGPPPGGGPGGSEGEDTAGSAGNSGPMGEPAGGGGSRVLTGAEQVAILDGQLNRGTGDFDDLILRERGTIQGTAKNAPQGGGDEDAGEGYGAAGGYYEPPMASSGAGQGGAGPIPRDAYDADIPQQTASYPPPADIPSGTDDDVVARQLREAAMREPDPTLREKLWDEYRRYKGVD